MEKVRYNGPVFEETLTLEILCREYIRWKGSGGELRFGQHICNKYLKSEGSCPNIFYEEKEDKVFDIIRSFMDA